MNENISKNKHYNRNKHVAIYPVLNFSHFVELQIKGANLPKKYE